MEAPNPSQFHLGSRDEFLTKFTSYIQQGSVLRMQKYCPTISVRLDESFNPESKVYGDEMSMILVWGGPGKILLKVHYTLDNAKYLASVNLSKPVESIDSDLAYSTMRELSNFQGGYFRGVFEEFELLMGMSLPFLLPSKDDSIFQKIQKPTTHSFYWKALAGDREFYMSAEVEFSEIKTFQAILPDLSAKLEKESHKKQEDEGEIEFL